MKSQLMLAVAGVLLLSGCTVTPVYSGDSEPSSASATPACESAAVDALAAEKELQATHPVWVNDAPIAEIGSPEAEAWAALVEEEEALWLAIMRPVYETCEGPEDWWAVVQSHPGLVGMTRAEFVTRDMLAGWCYDQPGLSACSGYDEWLDDNKE